MNQDSSSDKLDKVIRAVIDGKVKLRNPNHVLSFLLASEELRNLNKENRPIHI
jgi:hypothetical protein